MNLAYKFKQNPAFFSILFLLVCFGVVIGHGLFTFVYAKGFSYLSDDPAACKNCHVMNQVYESWSRSSHKDVATCNSCHVPHTFFAKWAMKAESGFHHGYAFTFKDNPVAFTATEKSKKLVQQNCISCHKDYAQNAVDPTSAHSGKDIEALSCVSCHRQIGHAHNY